MNYAMNIDSTKERLENIKLHKKEEDIVFDETKKLFPNFKNCYKTDNTASLDELGEEIIQKSKIVTKIHNDNIFVIDKNIVGYINTSADALNVLKKIDTDVGD